ncbi:MAG TPA: NADH-quinone oxidoreductase subunit C [Deltaproteobacteria bacterium]|nr:NADH-quinone oxidoreductase subunit C [Deltaproteobacteria bacterium]
MDVEMDLQALQNLFPEAITEAFSDKGQALVKVRAERIHDVLRTCKQDPRFAFDCLMDVIGVDYLGQSPRFEVVYLLYSLQLNHRLRLRVRVEEGASLPSATDLWASADWAEREVWDMYGIPFAGHPNLKRILLFEGFEGHPLRKDYPTERRQKIPQIEEIP